MKERILLSYTGMRKETFMFMQLHRKAYETG